MRWFVDRPTCLLLPMLLVLFAVFPVDAGAQTPPAAAGNRYVTIDFNNVDINVFIKFISELTGQNFVVDQRVKGQVTIISPTKISVAEAFKVFESVLEVHGFTTVKSGEVTKIIPQPDARSKNIETMLKKEAKSPDDRIVTQLIRLRYADVEEIKRLFAPLISKSSVVLGYPPTNTLIVTDVYSNITRLMKILEAIDVEGMGQEISILPLKFAEAANMAKILDSVFRAPAAQKDGPQPTLKIVPDDRTNTVVVQASEVETIRIKSLIEMLDKEIPKGKERIHVYYLENANAEDLAETLQALPSEKPAKQEGKQEAPVVSQDVKISADKATNSLIIMAEKEDYLVLEEIIKKLDIPRAMVYLESLIMEVNVENDFAIGTDWTIAGEGSKDGRDFVYGASSRTGEAGFTIDPTTGRTSFPAGFAVGILGEGITLGGITLPSISALINVVQDNKDVNILSTPQILTTDNEEATIIIGKNVPFQTRSAAESATETYSSFEYRDVAITLKITPQISKDRLVRLKISQELTKLDELAATFQKDRPTTLKRTIETTVIVEDGNTVVIGGLMDDQISVSESKVPLLGDIPILGWLFKSKKKSFDKTNLYVFLTPRVVQHPSEAVELYEKKKGEIDTIREGSIKMYEENR
ncbi:MAG: type II secretion system secretin GspD [Desulfobacterales bacterium]|nr:type II secretion system secretin GspD [Desulfobacterales bacterium]